MSNKNAIILILVIFIIYESFKTIKYWRLSHKQVKIMRVKENKDGFKSEYLYTGLGIFLVFAEIIDKTYGVFFFYGLASLTIGLTTYIKGKLPDTINEEAIYFVTNKMDLKLIESFNWLDCQEDGFDEVELIIDSRAHEVGYLNRLFYKVNWIEPLEKIGIKVKKVDTKTVNNYLVDRHK